VSIDPFDPESHRSSVPTGSPNAMLGPQAKSLQRCSFAG
jgi:hypothetical protein